MTYAKSLTAALFLSLSAGTSLADTAAIHMGFGLWQADPEGSLYGYSLDELNYKKSDNNFFYAAIEHPIPLLPNIRIQYNELETKGSSAILTVPATSRTKLNHTDAVAYYELLDNWISFDLGLGVRRYDGGSELVLGGTQINESEADAYLPTIYADANFDLPFTGLSVGGNFQGGSFDDTEFTEYSLRLSYMYDAIPDVGAELGYKRHNLSRLNDLDIDADFAGPYLSLKLSF
ncbi:TIGR04219 family outer membrane beta-barrel protein [Simiduia litorea]|uniref:TIGR04219 family outer membrane beta-barrel protein n=1 Tax=Simiduia litorea TaxID=1435348 RepID=UPI0036F1CDAD